MEDNDNERLQIFDGITTYSYTGSAGCDILIMFQKNPTELNSNWIETLTINIEKTNTLLIILNNQTGIDLIRFIYFNIHMK